MNAWTPVVVKDDANPRNGTAGVVCSPQPYTKAAAAAADLSLMEENAQRLADEAADLDQEAKAAAAAAATAADLAVKARAALAEAKAKADGSGMDGKLYVDVRFDTDGQTLPMPVSALTSLLTA